LRLWCKLAACWAVAAVLGWVLVLAQRQSGWSSALALPFTALIGIILVLVVALRHGRAQPDWRTLAREIETRHPELDGRLLTAVQQQPQEGAELNYLQDRLLVETLIHNHQNAWADAVPKSKLRFAQAAHWLALLLFLLILPGLHSSGGHRLLARTARSGITVSPGDTSIERGNSLIVLARFTGALPATVELVVTSAGAAAATSIHASADLAASSKSVSGPTNLIRRFPLAKSLADPLFGGSVADITTNLVYHVEYAGQHTRDFKVTVFEHPRLERADANLAYPAYTTQPPKRIENTRRLTAVEGTRLDLELQLNKPIASARLVSKDDARTAIAFQVQTGRAAASLKQFLLETNKTYELHLVDFEGRTNKVPAQFVFEVVRNRTPEMHLASPRGDIRP
jgi:hypothetical protein